MVSRRRPNRITSPVAGHAAKSLPAALATAGGQIATGGQLDALMQLRAMRGQLAQPLPRDEYPYAFGPNVPLLPAPLDPVNPQTGRAEPRLWEYPVSWNLPGSGGRVVPWRVLRDAAEHPLVRAAITIRKEEVAGLDWDFTISRRAVDEAQRDQPGASRLDVETTLRERLRPAIEQAHAFWRVPDKGNGLTFAEWTSAFLEEHLVLDAAPIYPRKTLGGQLFSFEIVDGSTIKPLLDHRGGRPLPPQPAYQQNIHGFPRGEFTADSSDTGGQLVIPDAYAADQLVYIRRENRVSSPYGLSPVERCLLDLSLWMKRQGWLRDEYDEGVMPAGWMVNNQPGGTAWQPSQVAEYERAFNDAFAGQTAQRMRYRILPPGIEPVETDGHDIAEKFKPEFDLHLMKLVCMHLAVTVHELGFPEQSGLGGAGHAEGQDRLGERKGRGPTLRWMAGVFTDMSRAHLGIPPEIEFSWVGLDDDTEAGDAPSPIELVGAGLLTLNEARDEEGRPRFAFPEADKPFIAAAGSVTFLEGIEQRQQEQEAAAAERSRAQLAAAQQQPPAGDEPKPGDDPDGEASSAAPADGADADKAAEAAAYRRWVSKGRSVTRRFELHAIASPSDLQRYGIDPGLVTLGKAAAGPDPANRWPAWDAADRTVDHYTPLLTQAFAGLIDVDATAAAWIGRHATKGILGDLAREAALWLAGRVGELPGPLGKVARDLVADAYDIGDTAAAEVVAQAAVEHAPTPLTGVLDLKPTDWSEWEPGHPEAADLIADEHGRGAALRQLLDEVDITIKSVAAGRFDDMAAILAEGVERGDNADTIAAALRPVLAAPERARMIAVTETARAVSAAALERYRLDGIDSMEWQHAPDDRVCEVCDANAAGGPIAVGDRFPSGDPHPPAHPWCRCTVLPAFEDVDWDAVIGGLDLGGLDLDNLSNDKAAGRGQHDDLKAYWLTGEGAAKWSTFTELFHHLRKHLPEGYAKRTAAQWFHDRHGYWPGDHRNERAAR